MAQTDAPIRWPLLGLVGATAALSALWLRARRRRADGKASASKRHISPSASEPRAAAPRPFRVIRQPLPLRTSDAAILTRRLSDGERDGQMLSRETMAWAKETLTRSGVLCLTNFMTPAGAEAARATVAPHWDRLHSGYVAPYEEHHGAGLPTDQFAEVVQRSAKRYDMKLTPEFAKAYRKVLHGRILSSLVAQALGPGQHGAFQDGVVVSMPGAALQQRHADSPHLYDPKFHGWLPPFVCNAFVPLVDLTPTNGCTAFATGSHILAHSGWMSAPLPQWPQHYTQLNAPAGSLILFDCRTYHCGLPNEGDAARPIMYSLWAKNWYSESYFGTRSLVAETEAGMHGGLQAGV